MDRHLLILGSFLLLSWSAFAARSRGFRGQTESFIGWKGEVYHPNENAIADVIDEHREEIIGQDAPDESSQGSSIVYGHGKQGDGPGKDRTDKESWIELISWKPRAYLYHNFMSSDEADQLITLATPQLKPSMVVAPDKEEGYEQSDYRTSYGMFLKRNQNDLIKTVQSRIANWTHLPEINQEDIQILRYGRGQQYRPHMDVLTVSDHGKRIATVLMYLKDCMDGGETAFPSGSEWLHPERANQMGPWSDCARGHVAVHAKKGDALLFFSLTPNGDEDPHAEHAGCPVLNNASKYTATVWIHTEAFRPHDFPFKEAFEEHDAGDCEDFLADCAASKERGECEDNPLFMKGDVVGDREMGVCRKTCGVCEPCTPTDRNCYFRNRQKAGYLVADDLWPLGGERVYKFPPAVPKGN